MSFPEYKKGVVECTSNVDSSSLKDKSVIVTGGAKGMGEEAVRAFNKAGAFVTFGDTDAKSGEALAKELGSAVQFEVCNVASWEDQLRLFKAARAASPRKSVDVVVANAGISGPDVLFNIEDSEEPEKPTLTILEINLHGVMYSMKLARHYFSKQPYDDQHDRCFIINASLVGFLDVPGIPQYMSSKFAHRALMRCLRRTTAIDGVRSCLTCPWYVATTIQSPAVQEYLKGEGIVYAEAADAGGAMIKIASDRSINGRSFGIVPRDVAPHGYYDVGKDDFEDGELLDEYQKILLRTSHRLKVKAEEQ